MEMILDLPKELIELAELLKPKGELFVVGGFIRNSLLGIKSNDIDICSSILCEDVCEILKDTKFKAKEKSKKLGTLSIQDDKGNVYEYATFRKEVYETNSGKHFPISVEWTTDIREDAKRRDFTMNCIYYSILKKNVVDIYSGVYDIQKRIIRCVETPNFVFQSDGQRILRMIRFACELNFKFDRSTFVMAKKMSYRLKDISGPKKYEELKNILNSPYKYPLAKKDAFIKGLNLFNSFSIWSSYGIGAGKIKLNMVKKVDRRLRFMALLVDIIDTVNPDCVDYYLSHLLGNDNFMMNSRYMNTIINVICGYYDALNQLDNKEYFTKYFDNFMDIGYLLQNVSRRLFNKYIFFYRYITNHKLAITTKDLKITVQDIKKHFPRREEKKYKKILNSLLSKVFEGELENKTEALLKEIKDGINSGSY
ncbi:MAG: CCA tRNA nucleotidyltransferase [Clostridia bacterium]|nr:CCA tRNA nucleotidyltransferase [Clostridia bacterium]